MLPAIAINLTHALLLVTTLLSSSITPQHVPQVGQGADAHHNDCAAASAAMLIEAYTGEQISVDQLYDEMNVAGDRYLNLTREVQPVLRNHGVDTWFYQFLTAAKLQEFVDRRRPVIALVNYGILKRDINPASAFSGPHAVVVVAADDSQVWLYDPLLGYGPVQVSLTTFRAAHGPRYATLVPKNAR